MLALKKNIFHTKSSFVASLIYPYPDGSVQGHEIGFSVDEDFLFGTVESDAVRKKLGPADRDRGARRKLRRDEHDRDDAEETHLADATVDDNLARGRVEANLMGRTLEKVEKGE